ncbi:hypothetical protein AB0J35_00855 [Nonomuraea angiospora]|uniref:hypothetical protein n=1 Tax=Nonomuraea angiospora TaxID=46172 RepID=UPI00343EEB31
MATGDLMTRAPMRDLQDCLSLTAVEYKIATYGGATGPDLAQAVNGAFTPASAEPG